MSVTSLYPRQTYGNPINTYPQQFPGMQLNMPLGLIQTQQQSSNELIGVHGLDSAKQYPVKPNTTVPTFDLDSDHAFILNADANGVLSVKIINFHVVSEEDYRKAVEAETPVQLQKSEYEDLLTRMKKMEEELENAKQLIREQNIDTTKPTVKPSITNGDPNV